jgi:multiple sugar transport system substrate-binding protein
MQRKSYSKSSDRPVAGIHPPHPQGRSLLILRAGFGRAAAWVAAALLVAMALSGCSGTLTPPVLPPYQGVVLRVGCPQPLGDLVRSQSRVWQAQQQASVEIVAPGEPADVWIMRPAALPGLTMHGKLTPFPATLRQRGNAFDWSSLLPVYREQLLSWDGTIFALPLAGESPVCLYRADLLARPQHQQQFRAFQRERYPSALVRELRPPTTWDDFALIAEYFQQHHPSGKPAPSLPPLPAGAEELDRLFYTIAATFRQALTQETAQQVEQRGPDFDDKVFSFHYRLKTGAPNIDSPGFVAALHILQRLGACMPAEPSAHPEEAFRDGKAVLCLTDAGTLLDASRDTVGICAMPGSDYYFTPKGEKKVVRDNVNRVPYLGGAGWLAAVPAGAAHPAAAFDLLADLCGPARSMQIVLEPRSGGGPVRAEQVMRERWDSFDLDPERSLALREAVSRSIMHGLENPVLCLRIPDAEQQRDVLVGKLREALTTKGDAAAALKAVAGRWQAMNEKKGMKTHLRDLRLSLGLRGN